MKRCRLSTETAIKVYNYRGVMKKNTNIGIYVRYSENMDTWKMSENHKKQSTLQPINAIIDILR